MGAMTSLLTKITVVVIFIVAIYQLRGWLVRNRMRRERRWLEWADVDQRAQSGEGYIIVNHGNIPGRVWWVNELPDGPPVDCLLDSAFLTNCPMYLRKASRLRRRYPNAKIVEVHDSIFG